MSSPIVKVDDLCFHWDGQEKPTLDIEQLVIEPGHRIFIEGPSGSGKTSLLNLIGAVTVPTSGTLEVLGQDLAQLKSSVKDKFRADHIGFIFQQFNLVPYLSMIENITLPCHFSALRKTRSGNIHTEALRLLSDLGLSDPDLQAKPVTELSVGQQQRVAAARAVIGRPEIVIADEPTSALDADAREAFIKLLFEECDQFSSTLIFVSHDRSLGSLFDQKINLPDINRADPDSAQSRN